MILTPKQEAEKCLADVLQWLARETAVPAPDVVEHNYAKWNRPDGGFVIFRANYRGDFGTLDVYWREEDGGMNSPFAPKSYEHLPRLARDIRILIALKDEMIPREVLQGLGKK